MAIKSLFDYVNPLIGTTGEDPHEYGGMIPSTAPPFGMTRWTPMTRENWVSRLPYHYNDKNITGFMGTHQPAIWMGDYGYVTLCPGTGTVRTAFADRGMPFSHSDESTTPFLYRVNMTDLGGNGRVISAEHTATSRVGFLRFHFDTSSDHKSTSHIIIQATRASYTGQVHIDPIRQEISGYNPERQDYKLGPFKAPSFKGYFVARFDTPFESFGTATGATLHEGETQREDEDVSAYVRFASTRKSVQVRVATSFLSIKQARENLDREIPDGKMFEAVVAELREAWAEKLETVAITGGTTEQLTNFYTGMYHALQYPSEFSEYGRYYSGYDDQIHEGEAYTSYSIWDTFRAETAFLTMFAPERINGMITSMLQVYEQGGWLPMWQNPVETNIMVGTHVDSIIAEVMVKGFRDFDLSTAWAAVHKDATVPPDNDTILWYGDRDEGTPVEARAGLTAYMKYGWVDAAKTAEAASRTLDYAFDDWAVAVVANLTGHTKEGRFFTERSKNYANIFNKDTGFMEARFANGSWAGEKVGWTEGDHWVYTFDVMHDIPGLVDLLGKDHFITLLDTHFDGGWNRHDNEPSHHIPYTVRDVAEKNYHALPDGLSGNDDCGQMSAWYILSSFGFYPVNPPSGDYVVGSPFFEKVVINFPGRSTPLVISSPGATENPYVKSLKLNGRPIESASLSHNELMKGGLLEFEMSATKQTWG
ncbi:glycoside hydrolase family 92 protein [Botryobasidium botryosum FD-172 SS1]|uniref:Glycoside hydrolase family 92 protein n=1 Tax=Botryobasidium botryosum (strain FD-172 SS1) TaxID=930990 RepID=A0A067M0E3_BOTB1|nr:glycoside hydrolase family 92 protein [Botryobasidium botryosum FD-172 SS1]